MSRTIGITLLTLAMAAPGTAAVAQETKERPAPPPRAVERQSSGGATSGAERAVPRSAPSTRAESPQAAAPAASGRATGAESGQSRRGSSGSQGSSRARSAPPDSRGGDVAVARSAPGGNARSSTGVQATDRDRGGRQSFGSAVPRQRPPHHGGGGWWGNPIWYYPYYPLSYGFFWDPWWGYGAGWGAGSAWGYGGGYGAYQGPVQQVYGGLRLKVKPKEAEVFVDGYFAGIVDDFDGAFQQLNLDVGPHRIEVRHPGHEVLAFEIRTQPDEKITYKGKLKPTP